MEQEYARHFGSIYFSGNIFMKNMYTKVTTPRGSHFLYISFMLISQVHIDCIFGDA